MIKHETEMIQTVKIICRTYFVKLKKSTITN